MWRVRVGFLAADGGGDTRGLKVPRADAVGKPLAPAVFKERRVQMLSKAQALWNELDKTTAERYDEFDMIAQ